MEQIFDIFKSLGADGTFVHQFVVFVIAFMVLKNIFFNKLLFVIKNREDNTTKLEENANDQFTEAEKLAEKYKLEIDKANSQALGKFQKNKEAILKEEGEKLRTAESRINSDFNAKRDVFVKEVAEQRTAVLAKAPTLSNSLVDKLTS
ncbi:MAG: hypothetical protein HN509_05620 [Halobacteriovoraceae bacterium]|jgi:F-type H+-transporting ATPase subunit b|nr:hypothetical protein [Halobacteriovoraceae bacterium]MBT5096118.1 hypothetical protein [Halobacteriovoraceae bacterium]